MSRKALLSEAKCKLSVTNSTSKGCGKRQQTMIPKETLIHIHGMPFVLVRDTFVYGNPKNYKLAKELTAIDKLGKCTSDSK